MNSHLIKFEYMNISITNNKSIEEIQKEFNDEFAFLKIQFFKNSHKAFQGSGKKELLNPGTKISSLVHHNGAVEIAADMTVDELEKLFKKKFGLNIQIFRKSGRSWLETTFTDNWTLEKQNEEGRELSVL